MPIATALDKDRKVARVLRMIAAGTLTPDSKRKLAKQWSMDEQSVSHLISDAFRIVRLNRGNWEEELDRKLMQLEADRRTALKLQKHIVVGDDVRFYPAPDVKAAVRSTELYLHAIGAMVRKQPRKHPEGSLEDLRQKRDAVRSALGDLEAVIEQKEAGVH